MNFQAAMHNLEAEAGSHFAPKVMAAFRPIAREVFDRLSMANEKDMQRMLEQRIRMHFTSDFPPPERGKNNVQPADRHVITKPDLMN